MAALLIEARDAAGEARRDGKTALGPQALDSLTGRYRELAAAGLAANLYRRTATAKDARRIARRFLNFEDMILRFATRRTIKAVLVPAWVEFDGAAQVAQLRRTATKKGKKTVEVACLITSDRDADPATLAAWVRGHWEIENCLHWVRDVTYLEDKSLVRTGTRPA